MKTIYNQIQNTGNFNDSFSATSRIKLSLLDNTGKAIGYVCNAIIEDQLKLSIGSTWENGPIASMMEKVKNFMSNNLMEMAATFSGNYAPPVLTDEYTQKTFKENSQIVIPLKFRLYYDSPDGTSNPIQTFRWLSCSMFPVCAWDLLNSMQATINAAEVAMQLGTEARN